MMAEIELDEKIVCNHWIGTEVDSNTSEAVTSCENSPKYTGTYGATMDAEYLQNVEQDALLKSKDKNLSKSVRSYYSKQRSLIESFLDTEDGEQGGKSLIKAVALAGQISFLANLFLIIAKGVAVGLSGSLAIISSLVDSAVDLVSGVIIWYTSKAMRKIDIYNYPIGRTRLEPVAIVILSCIMASASVVIFRESLEGIISKKINADLSAVSISLVAVTIVTKLVLYLYCRRYDTPSTKALATDHLNDTVSNSFALLFGALGSYVWKYADPIGAMIISIYIFYNWWKTGAQQIKNLTGKTAPSHLLQRITWIAVTHDDRIEKIETVRAFRTGNRYLAEVDIVLPEDMHLEIAHNIGETLQRKIEQLDQIERAFVHADYEYGHVRSDEHKFVTA
eukprot:Seg1474.5 transcript_id=Seg1474.5/GoldUCD/mRNA.D3Y31 product="Metal tolerance protein 10" protein_id=Seg1474.5/GoldUCD/D3Y31